MLDNEFASLKEEFEAYHSRFGRFFSRQEPREQSAKYLRGLMSNVPRKNGWHLAEVVGDETPDKTQRLLSKADWDADQVRDEHIRFCVEVFGESDGIGIFDETGFLKQGKKSVGVHRQYTGTAGKITNCQIGTFLAYHSSKGHVLLDRMLYLPEVWTQDPARLEEARVPKTISFQTKPDQALTMFIQAIEMGVPLRWITGDEVYGNWSILRDAVILYDLWYVFAVKKNLTVHQVTWKSGKKVLTDAQAVGEILQKLPERKWERFPAKIGTKGPILYDWARVRIQETREGEEGPEGWLMFRRSIYDPTDVAFYLSNTPESVDLKTLARIASSRFNIEQCFEETKSETGLDEYETRTWVGWHRHITLSMMAHSWLASITLKKKTAKTLQI